MRRLKQAAIVLVIVVAAAQLVRPERTNPATDPSRTIRAHVGDASGLPALLDRSCRDCHSNATVWPWYTQIAPASWLMAYGVMEGRKAVNFSEWAAYPPEAQRTLLSASCQDASDGKMPGPYTLLHPETRLSPQDVETICAAARLGRHEHGPGTLSGLDLRSVIMEGPMNTTSLETKVQEFLAQKRIAVAGVSRNKSHHPVGNLIYQRLKKTGHDVFPVNPHMQTFEGDCCYPDVQSIPGGVDGVVIITRPEVTEQIVHDCSDVGVRRVWMHQSMGKKGSSVSPKAVEYCRQHDISVIAGACPMMFGRGADFGHTCMRLFLKLTRGLPA
jgi:hypothetical protein